MLITEEYIMEHRTDAGSWTKQQLHALGIAWPPIGGWKVRIVGNEISEENDALFRAKRPAKYAKGIDYLRASKCKLPLLSDFELNHLQKLVTAEHDKRYSKTP